MSDDGERRFAVVLTGAFAIAVSVLAASHEPWRDEHGPWGVALASDSLTEFLSLLRYSGHGRLWHLCVFAIERSIGDFRAVQALAALFATATVYVVACFAPFTRTQRALFAFGYFPLYEYGTIARPYGLGLLAVVAACALFRRRNPLPLAAALFVLAQTTVYGVILAAGLAAARTVEALRSRERPSRGAAAAASALFVAGIALAVAQLIPPADSGFAPDWRLHWERHRAAEVAASAFGALLPIPQCRLDFWGTNLLDGTTAVRALLAALLLAGCTLLLKRSRAGLVLWCVVFGGLFAFGYVKYLGALRHHGHFFVAFVAACWIAGANAGRARSLFLTALLGVHVGVGALAGTMDVVHPFSAADATAKFLRARDLDRLPILGDHDSETAGVAAALSRPFFFPSSGRTSTFVRWDDARRLSVSDVDVVRAAGELAARERSDVVLVVNRRLAPVPTDVEPLAEFTGTLVGDEGFYVYRMCLR